MTTPDPQPEGLEPRVAKLETGQESMSERIDKILGLLDRKPEGDATVTSADPAPAADMGEAMRQAVRDVHAERDQAAATAAPEPEKPPREVGQPLKQRAARVLYGKDPKR